jgi:signal transduction histidine kinase
LTQAAIVAQDLTAAAFVALAIAIAYNWYRDRTREQAWLAAALGALGLVAALGRIPDPPTVLSLLVLVLFMLSAFFVFLFRGEFIPLRRAALRGAYVLLLVGIGIGVADVLFFQTAPPVEATALGIAIVLPWAILVGEPIARFWLASNRLPVVQRTRMRFLSFGFALLIAVLFISVIGDVALRNPAATILIQLAALVSVPAIYVSFAPPALLRRIWRLGEEPEVRAALQDLLIFSPNRKVMAERAAYWAARMMGASAGFIVDADGKILAATGIDLEGAAALAAGESDAVITAPLHLTEGLGRLAIVAGSFTPVFGTEEVSQLRGYANAVSAGIDRAQVTERMAALESNKTQFLNLASHELRGPLTVIRGYVSMLGTGMFGELNERGRNATEVMNAKVVEMNDLIEEMIEAARLEEGGVTLRAVEIDLRDIARDAREVVAPLLEPGHDLVMDLPDRRVRVKVDPDRTKTIVANLLSNAIKYSPDGGTITCQVRSRSGVARVTVSDHGIGISREGMAMLFTRFGRVITPQTEHLRGTGLGLFLGRQLARLQGGDITVASVEGEGSTFTLQLPIAPAGEAVAGQDAFSEPAAELA